MFLSLIEGKKKKKNPGKDLQPLPLSLVPDN